MNKYIITLVLASFAIGCTPTKTPKQAVIDPNMITIKAPVGTPVVARAMITNEACNSAAKYVTAEFGDPVTASLLIMKTAEMAVNYVAESIAEAAREDRETFTITGQSTDFLFSVDKAATSLRQCLHVVVAAKIDNGHWCGDTKENKKGNWYSFDGCTDKPIPKSLRDKWTEWSFADPVFYAEINLTAIPGGPRGTVIPKIYKLYYPAPLSSMEASKVKGLSLSVTATKPTHSTKTQGVTLLEVFLGGDGVLPRDPLIAESDNPLKASGSWVTVPSPEGAVGTQFAGPVNLSITLAETPNPTKWLQTVAKYVEENKQKAIDAIVEKADPAKKEEAEKVKTINDITLAGAAATACGEFSQQMTALATAHNNVTNAQGVTGEAKLQLQYLLSATCAATRMSKITTTAAWVASGKKEENSPLCGRHTAPAIQDPVGNEITALCPNS